MKPSKIRILCVIDTLGSGGGAEQLVYSLATEFRKIDIEIEFVDLFTWEDDLGNDLEVLGFKVHRLHIKKTYSWINGLIKLIKIIQIGKFDVVWGHLYFGNLYTQVSKLILKSVRTVITLHSEGYLQSPPKKIKSRFRIFIEGWLNSRATLKIGVSKAVAEDYKKYFGWKNIQVVYNGVPTLNIPFEISMADRKLVRKQYGIGEDDFCIVVPSRLVKKKGHIYLLKALHLLITEGKLVPKVIFFGEKGGEYKNLSDYILKNELINHVQIQDNVRHNVLFLAVLASNVVVLPSLREPFGIAAAEVMAMKKPLILTRIDGFIELIGDSVSAYLVAPESPRELADALYWQIDNPEQVIKMAARGRQRILENFDISYCAEAWKKQFLRAMSNNP